MKITKTKKGLYTTVVGLGQDRSGKMRTKRFTAPSKDALLLAVASYRAEDYEAEHRPRTFEEALDAYLTARSPHRSPATIRGYKIIERGLKARYNGFIQKETIKFNDGDVQHIIDSMFRNGYSHKTIKNWVGLINSVLIAEKCQPASVIMPQKKMIDRPIPSEGEIRMMLCLLHNHPLEVPFNLAILGLRRGEICALDLSDLNRNNILYIHKAAAPVDGGGICIKDTPKTDTSNRYVKVPDWLAEKIRKQGCVSPYAYTSITRAYQMFLRKYKFPPYRLHDCRHFFASYCHEHGVPEADILAGGGWKTANVMKNIYRHSMAKNRAGAAIASLTSH